MKDINNTLTLWMIAHGTRKGLFGSTKSVNGWKWPTKQELRQATGGDADEFDAALEEAVENGWVVVRNGRVGLESSGGADLLGRQTIGKGSF